MPHTVLPSQTRVLIVEDAPQARELAIRMLNSLGYIVTAAADAQEALTLFAKGQRFDILFTDIIMPGMDGITLAHELHAMDPSMRILFTSGFSEIGAEEVTKLDAIYVAKPYRKVEIAEVLQDMLQA